MSLPDNYDLFRQHDSDLEDALEARPMCDCCEEHIQDDFYYEIGNEIYCERCMNDNFRKVVA